MKGMIWGEDIMVRSESRKMYRAAGVSVEMLELTIHFVFFFKSLSMRMNSNTL